MKNYLEFFMNSLYRVWGEPGRQDAFVTRFYEVFRHVAMRHSSKERDIAPELYEEWLESLVETVREFDLEFTDEVELSWRVVLSPGIAYMKFRHDHF
jgi:hypothetical protein